MNDEEYKSTKSKRPIGDTGPRARTDDSLFYAFLVFIFFSIILILM